MNRRYNAEQSFLLQEYGGSNQYHFTLLSCIGEGRRCVCYDAERTHADGSVSRGRLKHLRPLAAALGSKQYAQAAEAFLDACKVQMDLLADDKTVSPTSVSIELLIDQQDGTLWLYTAFDLGRTFLYFQPSSVYELLKQIRYLTQTVEAYHSKGYLLLDLTPSNVFVLEGAGGEGIRMFDFDSLIKVEDIQTALEQKNELDFSFSSGYTAPEVHQKRMDVISYPSDLYSIGVLLFEKLFGYLPRSENHGLMAEYDWDRVKESFRREMHLYRREIETIFRKTLHYAPRNRCSRAGELLTLLDKLVQPPEGYFVSNVVGMRPSTPYYIDRDTEQRQLHGFFSDHEGKAAVAIVKGSESGVGKTDFARRYVELYGKEYDAVQFVRYKAEKGLREMVDDMAFYQPGAEKDALRALKLDALASGRQKLLLVIDNFDEAHSADPMPAMENVHVLITTRYLSESFGPDTKLIFINGSDEKLAMELFCRIYEESGSILDTEQRELVHQLLDRFAFHPYATDMLARNLGCTYGAYGGSTATAGLRNMVANADQRWGVPGKVVSTKDRLPGQAAERNDIHALLCSLFSDLLREVRIEGSEEDPYGLQAQVLYVLCGSDGMYEQTLLKTLGDVPEQGRFLARQALDHLVARNWVHIHTEDSCLDFLGGPIHSRVYRLHPLVAEILCQKPEFKPNALSWFHFSANCGADNLVSSRYYRQVVWDLRDANSRQMAAQLLPQTAPTAEILEKILILALKQDWRLSFDSVSYDGLLLCRLEQKAGGTYLFCYLHTGRIGGGFRVDASYCLAGFGGASEEACIESHCKKMDLTEAEGGQSVSILRANVSGDVVLSDRILNCPVQRISGKAFDDCFDLETVVLPKGLEALETETFKGLPKLREVVLPDSLRRIDWAFVSCRNLKRIVTHSVAAGELAGYTPCKDARSFAGAVAGTAQYVLLPKKENSMHLGLWTEALEELVIPKGIEQLITVCGPQSTLPNLQTVYVSDSLRVVTPYSVFGEEGAFGKLMDFVPD